VKLTDGGHCPI